MQRTWIETFVQTDVIFGYSISIPVLYRRAVLMSTEMAPGADGHDVISFFVTTLTKLRIIIVNNVASMAYGYTTLIQIANRNMIE
jgi:hypothetical protein